MKVTTTSGSVYDISHGMCTKYSAEGERLDTFKVYGIKPFTPPILLKDIHDLPDGKPQIGMCIYIWGRDITWCSTPVISIEETNE
jgi:hypothetical protein